MPMRAPSIAASKSASAKTMFGLLPPSSSPTRFTVSLPTFMMCLPTSTLPVKATMSTSGEVARRSPTEPPGPVTTCRTPSGRPASSKMRASSRVVSGDTEAGLRIMTLPAASEGAAFQAAIRTG